MSLPHLILGLLRESPASGYDLRKLFDERISYFWTTEHTQIYRALRRMTDEGWVTMEVVTQEGSPDKKVYHITPAGRDEFRRWLAAPQDDDSIHSSFIGRIYFGAALTNAELVRFIERYIATTQAYYDGMDAIMQRVRPFLNHPGTSRQQRMTLLSLEYGLRMTASELEWLAYARGVVASLKDDPGESNDSAATEGDAIRNED